MEGRAKGAQQLLLLAGERRVRLRSLQEFVALFAFLSILVIIKKPEVLE